MRALSVKLALGWVLFLACAAGAADQQRWASVDMEKRLQAELSAMLEDAATRHPGTPGNLALEEYVARKFAASGLQHGEMRFPSPVFLPGETSLELEGAGAVKVLPMHPSIFRPGNFEQREFDARLVYLGGGTIEDMQRLEGTDLDGVIGVMEFDTDSRWANWLRFGVRGFVFLEPERYERFEALNKVHATEVAVPRFLAQGEAARVLREAAESVQTVRVKAEPSRWQNSELRNLWVFIPGSDPSLSGEVAVFTAPLDANCIVPELAFGAQSGANLFLLLRMFELFKAEPPGRSVLLAAVNAHTQGFKGERLLAWNMIASRADLEDLRDTINTGLRVNQVYLQHYTGLDLSEFRPEDEQTLIRWRHLMDDTTGRNISVKEPLMRRIQGEVNRIKSERIRLGLSGMPEDELAAKVSVLEERQEKFVRLLILFNKVGNRTQLGELTPEEVGILSRFVDEVIDFNRLSAGLSQAELEREVQNAAAVRAAMQGRRVAFVICLDADWSSDVLGFAAGNDRGGSRWAQMWGVNTANIGDKLAGQAGGKRNLILDTLSMRGGLTESYYFELESEARSIVHAAPRYIQTCERTPAFSLRNAFTDFGKAFLPSDTIDNLDARRFAEGMVFLPLFWREILNDRYVTARSQLGRTDTRSKMTSIQARTYKFDDYSATVFPDIPVPDTAVIIRHGNYSTPLWAAYLPFRRDAIRHGDVVMGDIAITDLRATAIFHGLVPSGWGALYSAAFNFDDDFVEVRHTIDVGEAQNKVDADRLSTDVTLVMFECEEFPIYSMADSSMAANLPITMSSMMALTGRGNSTPRKYGITGMIPMLSPKRVSPSPGAPAAMFFDGQEPVKLISLERRVALNATPEEPEGIGFENAAEFGRDFFRMAIRDFSVLNRARLAKLRDVADDLAREFLNRGEAARLRAEEARARHDHAGYLLALYEALGSQIKSYQQSKQTTDDMLKAVVVYMALLLPFCFFVQKLLFNFVKIEKEMGMFAVLFVVTFLVFRVIHPAFRVAQAAEAIFIAFIMGALGLFVISILRGRFEGEMQLIFRSFQGGVTEADVGYSTVTQKAMLIGVNNMKRRRVRTILTTATIVLIAFTMLSFTSISKKVNPTMVPRGRSTPYTGLMYHWPGRSTMDWSTLTVMRNMFAGRGQSVVRYWWTSAGGGGWHNVPSTPMHAALRGGSSVQIEGLLGVELEEDGFIDALPLVAGRNFSSVSADEVLIFASMAEVLGISEDDLEHAIIEARGRSLQVVGILDDVLFRNMQDINGLPLLPISRLETEGGDLQFNPATSVQSSPTEDIHDMGALFFVETSSTMLVPARTSELMGAEPYSISLKLHPDVPLWDLTELMLTSNDARFYIASETPFQIGDVEDGDEGQTFTAGIYYIGSSYSTSIGGLAILIIPLIIASTIILNTMLGSVYERKKEIAVYNAVGLNPHHIGTFFLAESFVYGVIGSVGGYLIGQVLSIIITQFDLVKGINFNYSSLGVAYVIMFTIGIVLLSTIYPATVATRAAVPSGKRKWSLPPREGNLMSVVFPFIYTKEIAPGIIEYLREYFARFTAASIGDLIATPTGHQRGKDEQGRDCYDMSYHLALAPFDLGVTQNLHFRLAYDEKVQAHRLSMRIERISGPDTNWVTTNRPFLERLRKYLMRWRNLDGAQQGVYVQQCKRFYGES